jgi:hypothetical protein
MQSEELNVQIQDLGSLHHYRTEIPNIIFQMKLDPWVFKAYCVFKMTAGDKGSCFKSNSTLSEEIGCSLPTLIKIKKQLVEEGLISIKKRKHESGGNAPDLIQIVDIWPENMRVMSNTYPKDSQRTSNLNSGSKQDLLRGVNLVKGGSKRLLPKQEHNEQEKKETATVVVKPKKMQHNINCQRKHNINYQDSAAASIKQTEKQQQKTIQKPQQSKIYPCLKDVEIDQAEKVWITSKYSEDIVKNAIAWAVNPQTKISTTLVKALKWACANKPAIPQKAEDVVQSNKKEGIKILKSTKIPKGVQVEICIEDIQIVYQQCPSHPGIYVSYKEKGFVEKLKSALCKAGCILEKG